MATHTPGPWQNGHMGDGENIWIGPDYLATPVAYVDRDPERGRDEHPANAALIAAAPDLLALALDFLNIDEVSARSKDDCRVFVDMRDWAPFIGAAKAAIAKAKG